MAMTMDQLKGLVEAIGLRYYLDPRRDAVMFTLRGSHIPYQMLVLLDMQGRFLQFRSIGFLHCKDDHPHRNEVLKVLGAVNYQMRLVKHAWDVRDGEIIVMADMWIMDGTVTAAQFQRMLENYVGGMDDSHPRLAKTVETGRDPGAADSAPPAARGAGVTEV